MPAPEPADLPELPPPVFDALLDLLFGDPRARAKGLEKLLQEHPEHAPAIRRRVELHEQEADAAGELRAGLVPGYRILRVLGEGGMGSVFLAEQLVPLQRLVALKVIKRGMDTRDVVARFERERQSLAVMDHDAIAKVHDCGTTPKGQLYFAMEYVAGEPIDTWSDAHRLGVRARIELFQQVCRGVQHAHQKGVIHRDLKPANVLVAERDGRPTAKIIDFGIARAVGNDRRLAGLRTEFGQAIGTPEFMSPEQSAGDAEHIDTRTDVYSLGAMLYQLVCGALPFDTAGNRDVALAELRRQLHHDEVPRPSTRLDAFPDRAGEAAAHRGVSPTALRRELRGDLDWIALRAMAREPERRYASAAALAEDLQRHLDGLPVLAGPPSPWYHARKFARRHRAAMIFAAFVGIAVLGGLLGTSVALARVTRSQQRFDLLRHVVELSDARREASSLFPAVPTRLPDIDAWLTRYAEPLRANESAVRCALATLEAGPEGDVAPATRAFLREQLRELAGQLGPFLEDEVPEMQRRREWAQRLPTLSTAHPNAQRTWDEARTAIRAADGVTASKLYREQPIDLRPQLGLVPLGMNPVTKLWEFYDLRSAWEPKGGIDPASLPIPTIAADGSLRVDDRTGIVFVLVPGGLARIGAQSADPSAPLYDANALPNATTHEVPLGPFFLARHELTQGQWQRLGGAPGAAYYRPGFAGAPITLTHPVENITQSDCVALLARHGLLLPTEAQWEYACRAGTDAPWWCGGEATCLQDRANVLDAAAKAAAPHWPAAAAPWSDDHVVHAPVGSFVANPWGLFDVHGNVSEWCRDGEDPRTAFAQGDGLQAPHRDGRHVFHGGSYQQSPGNARSAWRDPQPVEFRWADLGCRAARALEQ